MSDHDYVARPQTGSQDANINRPRLRRRPQITSQPDFSDHDYAVTEDDVEDAPEEVGEDILDIIVEDALEPPNDSPENVIGASTSANIGVPLAGGAAAGVAGNVAANSSDIVNLTLATPPKKRKRLSNGSPKSFTPKMKAANDNDDPDEEDGLTCPICMDTWEMSGEHRLVSLRCGHLFGDACIRRWLNESAKQTGTKVCPQCKTKAASKDIRFLYAKRLRAIDRTEEHSLREQLDKEIRQREKMQTELATLTMSYALVKTKAQTLEADNQRLKQIVRSGGGVGAYNTDDGTDRKMLRNLPTYKLYLERNIDLTREPGCRVMLFAPQKDLLITSQKSNNSLFPGYGLRYIDTPTFRPMNYLHASSKLLRDISLSADEQTLAITSHEPRAKLFDLRSNQVIRMFSPTQKDLWSCAMDRNEREHFLYLGAQNGKTYIYDVRFPESTVSDFPIYDDLSPVINVAPVPTGKLFPSGGFLVCKLKSVWFFEYTNGTAVPTRLNVDGPFLSMNFDAVQETLLLSARSNMQNPYSRYILGKLEKLDGNTVFDVKVTFFGSKVTPIMTRPSQIAVESNTLVAGYVQDAKQLTLFDSLREQRLQTMPVHDIVYDTCPVNTHNSIFLAALSESKCRIYKLTSTAAAT